MTILVFRFSIVFAALPEERCGLSERRMGATARAYLRAPSVEETEIGLHRADPIGVCSASIRRHVPSGACHPNGERFLFELDEYNDAVYFL